MSAGCLSRLASIEEHLEALALLDATPDHIHEAVPATAGIVLFAFHLRRIHAICEPLGQLHILDLDFLCEARWLGVVLDSGCFVEGAL